MSPQPPAPLFSRDLGYFLSTHLQQKGTRQCMSFLAFTAKRLNKLLSESQLCPEPGNKRDNFMDVFVDHATLKRPLVLDVGNFPAYGLLHKPSVKQNSFLK